VLGTVLVCTKFYNDVFYSNSDIALVSGVTLRDLNFIERYFLESIGYDLAITTDEFERYEAGLQVHLAVN
jgi:hypothetical protein